MCQGCTQTDIRLHGMNKRIANGHMVAGIELAVTSTAEKQSSWLRCTKSKQKNEQYPIFLGQVVSQQDLVSTCMQICAGNHARDLPAADTYKDTGPPVRERDTACPAACYVWSGCSALSSCAAAAAFAAVRSLARLFRGYMLDSSAHLGEIH
eukprot:1257168-Pleurochrysis_carterae.AAC.5